MSAAKEIETRFPEAKPYTAALTQHLFDARTDFVSIDGQLAQLDTQLQEQTKKANKLADHSDKSDAALAAASKKLWWYRLHWWGAWIALTLGVLACGVFAFLKFTGRLAIASAKVGI